MAKSRHYSPQISRFMVCVLYNEAQIRKMPMTKLTEHLLAKSLRRSESWAKAESSVIQETSSTYVTKT
jgi:hypothetical protein